MCFAILFLVHLCDKPANGGCSQICNKDGVKAVCSCKEGFELAKDGKSCIKSKLI